MRVMTALALLLFGCAFVPSAQAAGRDPGTYFFNDTFGNFHEELKTAREQGKQGIMVFFEMKECPFCHWMKRNVLNRPDVQAYYRKHFLLFPLDIEGDVEVTDFHGRTVKEKAMAFKEYRVRATPVIAFFNLDGKLIFRYTGRTSTAKEFLLMGHYVADGAYRKMPFIKYKLQHRQF